MRTMTVVMNLMMVLVKLIIPRLLQPVLMMMLVLVQVGCYWCH